MYYITWKINLIQTCLIDPLISRNTRHDRIIIASDRNILCSLNKLDFFLFIFLSISIHSDSLENRRFSESIVTRYTASVIIYNDIIYMCVRARACVCIYVNKFQTYRHHNKSRSSDCQWQTIRRNEAIGTHRRSRLENSADHLSTGISCPSTYICLTDVEHKIKREKKKRKITHIMIISEITLSG